MKEIKEKLLMILNTKTKKIVAGVVAFAIIMASGLGIYMLSQTEDIEYLVIKNENFSIEYGENISTKLEDYLDFNKLSKENKALVLKKANIKADIKSEEGKAYPGIGKYKVTITYEKEKITKEVEVKDTIAPVINNINEISFLQDTTDFNYAEYITANDLQEVTYTFMTDNIDVNTVGEYTMTVVAIDQSGNEAKKDVKVIVLEKPAEEADIEIITDSETGKVTTKVTTKETTTNTDTPSSNTTSNNNSNSSNDTTTQSTIVELSVPYINQYAYGAPMGCEGASLLQALQGKGYATNVGLKYLLDNMPYTDTGNPHNGFVSSPYVAYPDKDMIFQSIFPSALTPYGSKYGTCINTSGYSPAQLVEELKAGNPSVVYVTYKFGTPKWEPYSFGNCVTNMHVMTLIGYNSNTGQYKVMDPAGIGSYWVSRSSFENSYNALRYAITVR